MSVGKKKRKRIRCTVYRISTPVALAHNGRIYETPTGQLLRLIANETHGLVELELTEIEENETTSEAPTG